MALFELVFGDELCLQKARGLRPGVGVTWTVPLRCKVPQRLLLTFCDEDLNFISQVEKQLPANDAIITYEIAGTVPEGASVAVLSAAPADHAPIT